MEAWGVWLVALGVIVAGAAAVFAWVQAHAAVESLRDARTARDEAKASAEESARLAGEANAAFVRQAEAQEESNRLKVLEMTPPDWSGPDHVSGQLHRLTNTSQGVIVVSGIDIQPEQMAGLVSLRNHPDDGRYEHGDALDFMSVKTMAGGAEKMTISYMTESSVDVHRLIVRL
ncbi:hypothetical protein AB0O14_05955 [Microbacterium foliorum]